MAVRGLLYATSFEAGIAYLAEQGWATTGFTINTTNYHTENGVGEPHSADVDGASLTSPRTPALTGAQRFACWLRPQGTPAPAAFVFESGGSAQCYIEFQADGSVKVYRGDEIFGTLLETSATLMDRSVANWIAVRCVADNAGTLQISVNGVAVYSYSGDLQYLAGTGWNQLRLRVATTTADHTLDNLLILDSSDTWMAPPHVAQVKLPSSVISGALTGSASTGSARWENVDDPAGTSDYNEAAAAGDGDLYGTTTIETMGSVLAVIVCAEAERAGGITTLEPVVSQGGTTDYATAEGLPVAGFGAVWSVWETNPDTAATWVSADAIDADIGARFQA